MLRFSVTLYHRLESLEVPTVAPFAFTGEIGEMGEMGEGGGINVDPLSPPTPTPTPTPTPLAPDCEEDRLDVDDSVELCFLFFRFLPAPPVVLSLL